MSFQSHTLYHIAVYIFNDYFAHLLFSFTEHIDMHAVMSSHDSMGIVFKCLSKGAADFLVKPIRRNELKNLWQHVWRRCHSVSCFTFMLQAFDKTNVKECCFPVYLEQCEHDFEYITGYPNLLIVSTASCFILRVLVSLNNFNFQLSSSVFKY